MDAYSSTAPHQRCSSSSTWLAGYRNGRVKTSGKPSSLAIIYFKKSLDPLLDLSSAGTEPSFYEDNNSRPPPRRPMHHPVLPRTHQEWFLASKPTYANWEKPSVRSTNDHPCKKITHIIYSSHSVGRCRRHLSWRFRYPAALVLYIARAPSIIQRSARRQNC